MGITETEFYGDMVLALAGLKRKDPESKRVAAMLVASTMRRASPDLKLPFYIGEALIEMLQSRSEEVREIARLTVAELRGVRA